MIPSADPAAAVAGMHCDDVAGFDEQRAVAALTDVKRVRGYIDRYEASVTTRLKELHTAGQSAPATDLHTRNSGVSSKEALAKERRADALDQAPSVAAALADGTIGAEHADALANATSRVDADIRDAFYDHEADLATDATRQTPEEFARNCRDLIRSLERDHGIERTERQRHDTRLNKKIDHDGMYLLNARMHPELGHAVFNAIDAETAALVTAGGDRTVDRSHVAAEALGNLVTSGHQATRPTEAEIRIHVDEHTASTGEIRDGSVCEYDDGTPIPPASVIRLICNGTIVPIIIDPNGTPLDVGRTQRIANRNQRRALRAIHRTCAFHGCDIAFNRCEIHHIHEWEHGGPTNLENLLPICSRHHHLVHEHQWTLHLAPDRTLTIRQPDGTTHATTPPDGRTRPQPADLEQAHPTPKSIANEPPGEPNEPGGTDPPQLDLIA